eukprot:4710340-Pyramimonas_sp.AAC.1
MGDFKLSGPKANFEKGWRLLQEASEGCPKGIEVDPPIIVGRGVVNCLDPPPPKVKKTPASGQQAESDDVKAGGDSAAQP